MGSSPQSTGSLRSRSDRPAGDHRCESNQSPARGGPERDDPTGIDNARMVGKDAGACQALPFEHIHRADDGCSLVLGQLAPGCSAPVC
jgi:hypothetical protein